MSQLLELVQGPSEWHPIPQMCHLYQLSLLSSANLHSMSYEQANTYYQAQTLQEIQVQLFPFSKRRMRLFPNPWPFLIEAPIASELCTHSCSSCPALQTLQALPQNHRHFRSFTDRTMSSVSSPGECRLHGALLTKGPSDRRATGVTSVQLSLPTAGSKPHSCPRAGLSL